MEESRGEKAVDRLGQARQATPRTNAAESHAPSAYQTRWPFFHKNPPAIWSAAQAPCAAGWRRSS
jgi:hypothetical protein